MSNNSLSDTPVHTQQREEGVAHHPRSKFDAKAREIAQLLDLKAQDYSEPSSFFVQLSHVWSGLLGVDLSPTQCCAMMLAFKSCRAINNPTHADTADDLVGYSLIMTDLVNLIRDEEGWKTK